MYAPRRPLKLALLCGLATAGIAIGPAATEATTGPTPLAFPPRYKVTKAQAAPYLGRFRLDKPLGKKLIGGAYVGGYNEKGFVEGDLVVLAYGMEGRPSSWVGRTYEYHHVANGMIIDVISQANEEIFARMKLRPAAHGRLTGTLRMRIPPGPNEKITLVPAPRKTRSASFSGLVRRFLSF
jgi:hypothetical protein